MKGRVLKYAVCILLCISVLCLSVFAVEPSPTPTMPPEQFDPLMELNYRAAMQIIYNCMNAWGIEIDYRGYREFGNEISELLENWVLEFLDSLPSQYTIATWIAPWQAGYDYWGNSRYNESALDDIQEFVDWLIIKFGLISNSETPINPVYSLNGYNLYNIDTVYEATNFNGGTTYYYLSTNPNNPTAGNPLEKYFVWINGNNLYFIVVSDQNLGIKGYSVYYYDEGMQFENLSSTSSSFNGPNQYGLYWMYINATHYPSGGSYFYGDNSAYRYLMQNAQLELDGDVEFITANIVLPDNNPDYAPGDGIIIIDGQPTYEVVEFSGEITNLPAIVSTGTIENPEIDQIYLGIPAFLESAKDSITFMKQIVFRMPDEVLIALSAVLSAGVIFGFLRIMREH